jgi:hypothetical protein
MSHHRRPNNIRISWVHQDANDMPAVFEPDIFPGPSCIFAPPHTFESLAYIATHGILAFAHVKNIFVAGRFRHGADRSPKIFIGYIFPIASAVGCFPNATACCAKVKGVLVFVAAGCGTAPSATKRTNEPVFHFRKEYGIGIGCYALYSFLRNCMKRDETKKQEKKFTHGKVD